MLSNVKPLAEVRLRAATLALITLFSRLPFRAHYAYHWDTVNFLFAMRHFDMLHDQPHPTGYPLYVLTARLFALFLRDDHAALVVMSVLASGVAVAFLYALGRRLWGEFVGLGAALLLATSPLFWFYGEIGLPHAVDTAFILVALWLLVRVRQDRPHWWAGTVVLLALAGGFRPQTLAFLLPVALYAFWPLGWKRIAQAAALGAFLSLLWLVPLVASCGGLRAYLDYSAAYSARFMGHTSLLQGAGLEGVLYNARRLLLYTAYAVGAAWVGVGLAILTGIAQRAGVWSEARRRARTEVRATSKQAALASYDRQAPALQAGAQEALKSLNDASPLARWRETAIWSLLWGVPAFLFYLLVHMGQQGLVFVFLPILLLWAAAGLDRWPSVRGPLLAALVVVNGAVFLFAPEYPAGTDGPRLLTLATLHHHDADFGDRLAVLHDYLPDSTVVMAEPWHHLEYYAPGYPLLRLDEAPPNVPAALTPRQWPGDGRLGMADLGLHPTSMGQWFLILFDEGTMAGYPPRGETAEALVRLELPHGGVMGILSLEAEAQICYDTHGWELCR